MIFGFFLTLLRQKKGKTGKNLRYVEDTAFSGSFQRYLIYKPIYPTGNFCAFTQKFSVGAI
ncbi:hypothetical protein TREVI0001_0842 [Treponema vincentii ATCC 35580]|uniref:Uncharacterized protein n=1 Tax=Treponema vincentii ATCC 35580 TaxID=596324 RepID=C8PRF1_9SPIR|nr:hypothetical protein TREVI0001_0842 [Treponema vincentii ATCC 35580]